MRTSRPLTFALCALALTLVAACSSPTPEGWNSYGDSISASAPLTLDDILADPQAYDGETVLLEATIDECCPKKGCWMTFTHGDDVVRVTFLDYGFFVPLDSAGSTVRVEGKFAIREVPVDEARHYLEDAGKLDEAKAITEPQKGYELVAHGVLMKTDVASSAEASAEASEG